MHALPFDDPTFLSEGIIKQITVFFTNRRRVYFTKHNGLIGFENTAIMEYCSFYVHPWPEVVYLESKNALFYIFYSTGSVFENSEKPLF